MDTRINFGNNSLTNDTRGKYSEANMSKNNICRRRLLHLFPFLKEQNLYLRNLSDTVDLFLWNVGKMEVKNDYFDRKAIMDLLRYAPEHNQPIILYRGIVTDGLHRIRLQYNYPFSSTLLPEVSARFALPNNNEILYSTIMKIHVPAFTPFLWTGLTTQRYFSHQAEIILPPGYLEVTDQEWQTHVIDGLEKKIMVMECVFNVYHFSRRLN